MVSAAFKYVPQPAATTCAFSSVFILILWMATGTYVIDLKSAQLSAAHWLIYFFYSVGSGRPTGPPAWLWQTQAAWRAGWPRAQPTNQRHSPHPWRSQGRSWRPGTSAACRSANTDHNIKWFLLNAIFNTYFVRLLSTLQKAVLSRKPPCNIAVINFSQL